MNNTKQNKNRYAVILAGGSGTRFWPMSRQARPKQFLSVLGEKSLLQETILRVLPLIPAENILLVTNREYRRQIRHQTASWKIPPKNILYEPSAKNTAPAIAWAAARIFQQNPAATMAVLPADHLITRPVTFRAVLRQAFREADQNDLVTLGIPPTRPETGYGYMKLKLVEGRHRVEAFTEKPDLATAKRLIKNKSYFWNSGMFIWKASVIQDAFRKHLPAVAEVFRRGNSPAYVRREWHRLPAISVDYGILEPAGNVIAVPADEIGWSDLGSWDSLMDVMTKDSRGNILKGNAVALDCRDSLVWGQKKLVAAVGVEGLVVIDTPDALLICPREKSQSVREVIAWLKRNQRQEL